MRVLDLFSGIGAFSLGLQRAGFEHVAFCENADFPRRVLKKQWPHVPIISDIREINSPIECDVICGGFPCQPFSTAARGRNIGSKNLWPEMERVIDLCQPKYVIGENVSERSIRQSSDRLARLGYAIAVRRISGLDLGAWHQRNRWWVIAHPHDESQFRCHLNAEVAKLPEVCRGIWSAAAYAGAVRVSARPSAGMDEARLIALGNAGFPVITEAIGLAILRAYRDTKDAQP